jgi:ribosomal-protein-alanine N-acetyltransferase
MTIFKTKRTLIREITTQDIEGFYNLQSNPVVMEMIPAAVMTMDECVDDIQRLIKEYNTPIQNRIMDIWVVEDIETKDFIGTCGLLYKTPIIDAQPIKTVELGYRYRQQFWGNGFGAEVCKGLIDYVFTQTNFQKIIADVSKTNLGSAAILKNNMNYIGESFNEEDQCQDLHFDLLKPVI